MANRTIEGTVEVTFNNNSEWLVIDNNELFNLVLESDKYKKVDKRKYNRGIDFYRI